MRPAWLGYSPFEQVVHEGKKASKQLLRDGKTVHEIATRINMLLKSAVTSSSKWGFFLLIIAVVTASAGSSELIRWNSGFLDLKLPKLYLLAIGVATWLTTLRYFYATLVHMFVLLHLRASETDLQRFSIYRNSLLGDEFGDFGSPIRNSSLSSFQRGDSLILAIIYYAPVFVCTLPTLTASIVIQFELINMISVLHFSIFDTIIAYSTLAVAIMSSLYFILFFVPFRIRKNVRNIRWNFLYRINVNDKGFHPSSDRWL